MTEERQNFVRFLKADIEQSIPDRFRKQVLRHLDRTAAKSRGSAVTYRQLDEKSNQIAHVILAARGDGEEPVALLLDQGTAAVAAILGILKAGKFYVALEPSEPIELLNRIVADSQPAMIVRDTKYEPLADELDCKGPSCLNLETIGADISTEDPGLSLSPDRLAYIFYTSGSTGLPKGVFDCHRNILHNVMRYTNNLRISRNDRLSVVQSCSFSGTVSSLFGALLNGAAVFPFDLQNEGIGRMFHWINQEKITIFHSAPMIFEQLLTTGSQFDSLRVIRLEGDQAYRHHVTLYQNHFDHSCILANGFGATETGLIRQFRVTPHTKIPGNSVPIGYAIEDMEIDLVGEDGVATAPGDVGEITVRSRYLANGYWKRPDLTAKAFQLDPNDSLSRVYRTGDWGRMLPDGCLEYLGRNDFRVKIRGQRVEISEIENALCQIAQIKQAVVMGREDSPGVQQLVAYLVPSVHPAPTVSFLRRSLAISLPKIMIPARYVFLNQLPLDRNRKINRRALPKPNRQRPSLDQPFVPAATLVQKTIAKCFSDILGLDEVGLDDDFLELGGDSLKATELMLLIEEKLGMPCPTRFFFEQRTVAGLIRNLAADDQRACVVPIQSNGASPPLFCMHDESGQVLEFGHLARLLGPEQPVLGVQSGGRMHERSAHISLAAMAADYVREIRQVQPEGPYYLCGQCFAGLIAFEVAQQIQKQNERVALLILLDTKFPEGLLGWTIRRLTYARNRLEKSERPIEDKLRFLTRFLYRFILQLNTRIKKSIQLSVTRLRIVVRRSSEQPLLSVFDAKKLAAIRYRYRPAPYHGDMVLFCPGDAPRNQLDWHRVAVGSLKIYEIPILDNGKERPHLIQEPYVLELAETLKTLLYS